MSCCIRVLQKNKTNKMFTYVHTYIYIHIDICVCVHAHTHTHTQREIYYKGTGSHNYGEGKS